VDERFRRYGIANQEEARTEAAIAREENGAQHKADLSAAAIRDENGAVPSGLVTRVTEAAERIKKREQDWERRRKTAAANVETARRHYLGEGEPEARPAPTATQTSSPAMPTTITMADIEATARASGKTVDEVKAAAKAKGVTIK
jgi:hypothetical protein